MSDQVETVMVNCRAPRGYGQPSHRSAGSKGCGGKTAMVILKTKLPGGGMSIRYQCMDCQKPFSINF